MRSPLLPELTLLQSSEHPSHSWGCSSLPPCPGCTHPGGLTSCRGQAGLALPLPRSEGWQHTEGQGWNIWVSFPSLLVSVYTLSLLSAPAPQGREEPV